MAMPTSTPILQSSPSPQVVGNAFVEQYFHVLHESPESAYKFYQELSILSRPNSEGVMISVTTTSAINDMVLAFDFKNYIAQILTVDSQPSYNEGVFVLVTGCLTGKDKIRRKFTQSFFLVPQGRGIYFVLNDMFRFVVDDHPYELNQMPDNSSIDNALEASPTKGQRELVTEQDNPKADAIPPPEVVSDKVEEAYQPLENEHLLVEKEAALDPPIHPIEALDPPIHPIEAQPVPMATADATQNAPKKSYALIVKDTKGSSSSTRVYVPTTKTKTAPVKPTKPVASSTTTASLTTTAASSTTALDSSTTPAALSTVHTSASTKPVVTPDMPAPDTETPPTSSNGGSEKSKSLDVEGYSIYIRSLPMNLTTEQVKEEFKKFGPIKPAGVQVRHHKIDNFCFGFVEFESLDSVRAALEASPVIIGAHKAFIEEKRSKTRVVNGIVTNGGGRGPYPQMRGGFQNDNFRGRGWYGGNQGFGPRSDFRIRGEYPGRVQGQPGRTNEGYQQRQVYQNGYARVDRPMGIKPATAAASRDN